MQIVGRGAFDRNRLAIAFAAFLWHGNLFGPDKVFARQAVGVLLNLFRGAFGNDAAAVNTGTRAHVDHIVGGTNGVFVMFDDQNRIAKIPQAF